MQIFLTLGNKSTQTCILFCIHCPNQLNISLKYLPYDYYYLFFLYQKQCYVNSLDFSQGHFYLHCWNRIAACFVVALFMDLVEVILVRLCNQNRQYRAKIISLELSIFNYFFIIIFTSSAVAIELRNEQK